jgi:sulfate transport system ATP-binding protein
MSIDVQNVSKSFGTFKALDNISLELPRGELIALLGPSGCGKTTLLRLIAGLETADEGRIIISGEDAASKHARERNVGFVFQHYALFRHMSVFENVAFGLRVKPRRQRPPEHEIRARVMRLLDLVQLAGHAGRFPAQLSGGQRQRVALARALAVEPGVLLLDEPFGALDAKVRKELRRWLRELHDELHISSIFVTHDQEEALDVSDRVVLMNRGRIEQIGSPHEIYASPATAFAFSFIGAVNEFRGKVAGPFLRIGGDLLPHGRHDLSDGTPVVAFARPHDTEIRKAYDGIGIAAKVSRIVPNGSGTRVELIALHENTQTRRDYLEIELAAGDLAALAIAPGDQVRIGSRRLSVFTDG